MNLSIIIPARNGEILIEATLRDIVKYLSKQEMDDYEILVVINGTTDKTRLVVEELMSKNNKIKILESIPGYGNALRLGLKRAVGDYICIFNVDFYDLKMIDLARIDLCGGDFILGSKMTYWSEDRRPFLRRLVSKFFNLYLRVFFGFRGSDTHGIKIIKRDVVKKILPKCETSSGIFDTEFVLRSQYAGFRFSDFPVVIEEKRPARFKNRLFDTPKDLLDLHFSLKG